MLAIFDDLDTILLMIPLQIMMVGLRWQLIIIVLVVFVLLSIGWKQLGKYNWRQDWKAIFFLLGGSFCSYTVGVYGEQIFFMETKEVSILKCYCRLFVLGMVMKHKEIDTPLEHKVSTGVSFLFMFLVGMSMPLFVGVDFSETHSGTHSITGSQE